MEEEFSCFEVNAVTHIQKNVLFMYFFKKKIKAVLLGKYIQNILKCECKIIFWLFLVFY